MRQEPLERFRLKNISIHRLGRRRFQSGFEILKIRIHEFVSLFEICLTLENTIEDVSIFRYASLDRLTGSVFGDESFDIGTILDILELIADDLLLDRSLLGDIFSTEPVNVTDANLTDIMPDKHCCDFIRVGSFHLREEICDLRSMKRMLGDTLRCRDSGIVPTGTFDMLEIQAFEEEIDERRHTDSIKNVGFQEARKD